MQKPPDKLRANLNRWKHDLAAARISPELELYGRLIERARQVLNDEDWQAVAAFVELLEKPVVVEIERFDFDAWAVEMEKRKAKRLHSEQLRENLAIARLRKRIGKVMDVAAEGSCREQAVRGTPRNVRIHREMVD